jgi:hypothetical protein
MNADREWDEYEWERFLQQQDEKTEKYMELLERYIDHPDRDAIIAREMGWNNLSNADDEETEEEFFGLLYEEDEESAFDDVVFADDEDHAEMDEEDAEEEFEADEDVSFESHPLYQAAFALTVWVDHALDSSSSGPEIAPAAIQLSTQVALCSAKLAAALSGDDEEEIGMTIAYLKRSLRAIMLALDAALGLEREGLLSKSAHHEFRVRAFCVRDEIIRLMGSYREQWRRLHDS